MIIRFCGTNEKSDNGTELLTSLIKQIIASCCGSSDSSYSVNDVSGVYTELVKMFSDLVAKYPVILLIDSIDQLSDTNQERSHLSFLKAIKPHRDTIIIVSCLPDEIDPQTGNVVYWYGCDTRMSSAGVARVTVGLLEDDLEPVLDGMLRLEGRQLTEAQRSAVISACKQEPTALYVKLAVRCACKCKSSDGAPVLEPTVARLVEQIFKGIETDFGEKLTRTVLGFLALAKAGLADRELEDLLSLSDEVMEEVNGKYMKDELAAKRLPRHVLSRLFYELAGLIAV